MKISRNAKTTGILGVVALGMLGLGFAAVPLYDAFCKVTGFGGTTQIAQKRPDQVLEREVIVRLDTNTGPQTGLSFKAVDRTFPIHLGETGMVFFEISNDTDHPITAMAAYNVAPHKAGPYFNKLECFCFEERVFEPGAKERLPVIFYIDPEMDSEKQLDDITDITLSYTFYDTDAEKHLTARLDNEVSPH
ncbi:cytochrome c oxidase assembly protein [Hirschia baltica]|uniref:Cytochrome c oxidase assembly protein CtaG n=1 Tax=Hirschia baltica (strain ATCC 49814 / DSM 5838 / IFAM 1418) TaxID=582402 RepID=C6XR89_HIRBI|nr:cytochrome c oxidase assembly protein [Hirschia baltica]ACT58721.1 cytochrome c oxidase assembly protein CtaG/Cox11 [Hirschia baltica ATCC 49814]